MYGVFVILSSVMRRLSILEFIRLHYVVSICFCTIVCAPHLFRLAFLGLCVEMTVLRSREIVSSPESKKSQASALRNVVAAPETPQKTSEILSQSSKGVHTRNQNISNPGKAIDIGAGSIVFSESGSVRRLSARLAKKVVENGEVGSGKRKKREGTSISGVNARNLKGQSFEMEFGVESSDGNPDGSLVSEDSETVEDSVSDAGMGFDCDIDHSVRETRGNGRSKRRCSMEVKALGNVSIVKDNEEKRFLSLRSGKKVVKREIGDDIRIAGNSAQGNEHSKEGVSVFSGDLPVKSISEAKIEEDEKGPWKNRRFVRRKIGKDKVGSETSMNGPALVIPGSDDSIRPALGQSDHDAIKVAESSEVVAGEENSLARKTDICSRRRLSKEGKGKMKLDVETVLSSGKMKLDAGASSSTGINTINNVIENMNGGSVSDVAPSASDEVLPDEVRARGANLNESGTRSNHRERFRDFARRNASRFAHFSSRDELDGHAPDVATLPESSNRIEDWPGPFSTAMKIIKDRECNRNGGRHGASTDKSEAVELKWSPKSQEFCKHQKQVPLLQDICLSILSKNASAIASLDFVPDAMRHKICWSLCDSRRMDCHFLELLVRDTPTEIRLRDCSWLSEEQFVKIFEGCDTSKLMVCFFVIEHYAFRAHITNIALDKDNVTLLF